MKAPGPQHNLVNILYIVLQFSSFMYVVKPLILLSTILSNLLKFLGASTISS